MNLQTIFNVFADYSNFAIVIANLILIIFIYQELRDRRKPILTTKILDREQDVNEKPSVLEYGNLYLVVGNESKNLAHSIKINYDFKFKDYKVNVKKKLDYLNPYEATKFVLKYGEIRNKYPELFEEKSEGNRTIKLPKETLKIKLNVTVLYNPILWLFFRHKIKDTYEIEWGSLESYPRFEDHPMINCWNKRNNLYVYKLK